MTDVQALSAAIMPMRTLDPRFVARLVTPGRVRDVGWRTWAAVCADPRHASHTLRDGLRQARQLHSRERRPTGDLLVDLARLHRVLDAFSGAASDRAAAAWWLLAVYHGVSEADAADTWDAAIGGPRPAFEAAIDLPASLAARWANLAPAAVAGEAAGVSDDVGARLAAGLGEALPAFLAASARRAPVAVRVDTRRMSRAAALAQVRARGIDAVASTVAPHGLRLPTGTDLRALPRELAAALHAQDDASQLVAELVPAGVGTVLDLCAGAGGKTLALAARAPGARRFATDVRPSALATLRRRAQAAGVAVQAVALRDGRVPDAVPTAVDAVVVDAPCTGTGVWRRHPEWRLRLGPADPPTALQDAVLEEGAARVAPGGVLVYATCSVLPDEDEARVDAFLQRHRGFTVVPVAEAAPHLTDAVRCGAFLRTSPQDHDTDGFFGAVLRRER